MNTPIAVRIECAKEKSSTLWRQYRQNMRCLLHHGRRSFLCTGRGEEEAKIELINSTNAMMAEKDEELEKAKKQQREP